MSGVHGSIRTIRSSNETGNYDWLNSPAHADDTQSLDIEMGAGHLNARRALTQYKSGEWDVFTEVPKIGWDYHETGGVGTVPLTYDFSLPVSDFVAVTLAWDRQVTKSGGNDNFYNPTDMFTHGNLNDLNLFIVPVGWDDLFDDAVAKSFSFFDNVEHIFKLIPAGDYQIVVTHDAGGTDQDYGLAWWTGSGAPISGDFNGSGGVDGADLGVWRSSFGPGGGADADGDGDSDGGDFLTWQRNLGMGSAVPVAAAVPEPGSSVIAAFAACGLVVGVRRRKAAISRQLSARQGFVCRARA